MTEAPYAFEARCRDCRRKLGEIQLPRTHEHCEVVFKTTCRTSSCRGRVIEVRFDTALTITARAQGY